MLAGSHRPEVDGEAIVLAATKRTSRWTHLNRSKRRFHVHSVPTRNETSTLSAISPAMLVFTVPTRSDRLVSPLRELGALTHPETAALCARRA